MPSGIDGTQMQDTTRDGSSRSTTVSQPRPEPLSEEKMNLSEVVTMPWARGGTDQGPSTSFSHPSSVSR